MIKKMAIRVDEKVADDFDKWCKERGFVKSKKIELMMKAECNDDA